MTDILVEKLKKTFQVKSKKQTGLFRTFFPKTHEFSALKEISFAVEKGERVAFIGPNGSGKSTTIKILTSILYPTSGHAEVLGFVPWENRAKIVPHIGVVFGQRSQLFFHLPVIDSFNLLAGAYDIPLSVYKRRLSKLVSLLQVKEYVKKSVRQLSLGERMRCELIASLLHNPKILFLDEPTIGLDVISKNIIREFIKEISEEQKTTLLLTSHDTVDMESVCQRAVVINRGEIILDSPIPKIKREYLKKKIITVVSDKPDMDIAVAHASVVHREAFLVKLEIDVSQVPLNETLGKITSFPGVVDVSVENPSMEEVIRDIYLKG
ncbi:MAG: ATP-binding cassette domain-containing protein [Lactobacillales bacterium]|jgi:ABC-2 type transport system ATP-binding protein|nr:ATP-binding cassette domain-containing protein [Lactobacillales bacterium]